MKALPRAGKENSKSYKKKKTPMKCTKLKLLLHFCPPFISYFPKPPFYGKCLQLSSNFVGCNSYHIACLEQDYKSEYYCHKVTKKRLTPIFT